MLNSIITIDQKITEYLNNWQINGWAIGNLILVILALVLSLLLSGLIGIERERRGKSAGLRTHLIISLTSCIIMIISIYGFPNDVGTRDVARLAAQVVTGVGFLGAGAIIHAEGGIKGLTTAATIWLVMAIGLACGSMNFILAISGTLVVLVVLTLFKKVEDKFVREKPMFSIVAKSGSGVMDNVSKVVSDLNLLMEVVSTEMIKGDEPKIQFVFILRGHNNRIVDKTKFVQELKKLDSEISIELLYHR